MLCPRCRRENRATSEFCVTCGAPLVLRDEPPPRPLDVTVPLDRRGPDRATPPAMAPPRSVRTEPDLAPPVPENDRSYWDLGLAAAASAEPTFRSIPPPAPRAASQATWSMGPPPQGQPAEAEPDLAVDLDPELDVAVADEVVLRRAPSIRRALSWAIDLLPFVALGAWLVREATGPRERAALRTLDGALDLFARELGVILPFLGFVALAGAVYLALAYALMGASVGKWLTGLRVAGPDGRRPSPRRAVARALLAVLSVALLGLGVLLAMFTRSGR
ncbi:MAG TPA: RDD family protein, partial [Anaeromyxobacteraceae bacterium]|nr:RDD family protein [Anaeromyxobacteraceae bacterium]